VIPFVTLQPEIKKQGDKNQETKVAYLIEIAMVNMK